MKTKSILILPTAFTILLMFFAASAYAQQDVPNQTIQVIQFHSEHRCPTCLKIEKLTKETIAENFPNIPFKLVNVDDKQNKKMADSFGAFGSQLFLYNPSNGKKEEITDFAFMKVYDEAKYKAGLKSMIEDFRKD